MKFKAWVIIPGYNEESRIRDVIRKVKHQVSSHALSQRASFEIVVVDDGSRDGTYDVARSEDVIALRHVINLGKGAAVKTGCDYALSKGADLMFAIDADGQHNPEDIPRFLDAMKDTDMVFGFRTFNKKMPFVLRFGNLFINLMTRILFGMNLRDTQCGYRAWTAEAYRKIRWRASDYFMESEMIANAGKNHLRYKEIPIETVYSDRYKGTTVMDGVKIVFNMLLWKIRMRNF